MKGKSGEQFELRDKDAQALGGPDKKGFIVRSGSIVCKEVSSSEMDFINSKRNQLLADGVLSEKGGKLCFTKDCRFNSPSGAASVVLGRWVNGWVEWKHSDGRTLSEIKHVIRPSNQKMFNNEKRQEILDKKQELLNEGKIYTESELKKYYATFRSRFGPDVLRGLDGEELLELMHGRGNKDSLVYWLEFKNDEEFDTKRFGGIAGGSALKFRVFRRKETGNWQAAGKANHTKDISLEEAIEIARSHREQLLKGIQLLEKLPDDASDEDYAELQDQMDEFVPDISDVGWGHKYFSLLFPDKLDDFHTPNWQRFYILKQLQFPPDNKGRYICAGRYISAAKELNLPVFHLTSLLNAMHGRLYRYWRIGTRGGGTDRTDYWPMMRERACVAIGWNKLGDLSWVESKKSSREKLKATLHDKDPSSPINEGKSASEITHFIANMSEGDIVWAANGATILGIGRVTGEYRYEPEFGFPHQRSVEWLNFDEWKMPVHEGLRTTVREIKKHNVNIIETERRIQSGGLTDPLPPDPLIKSLKGISGRIQSVLERKGQVILYGPPGTGKTYWAERAANDLAAISTFGKQFADLDDKSKKVLTGDSNLSGIVRLCCFHPAYGYEDFIEGYRPHTVNENLSFELRDGIFKKVCQSAAAKPEQNFYLIIDEINRGDIPRIFGELLTILEKDKRSKQIILPVSQEVFTIPSNLFVIGTMNTADRSISLLDAALRRRFGFIEMMPDGKVLRDTVIAEIPLKAWFEALNSRIREHVGRDARNLQIGHSYLMRGGVPMKELASFKRAIREDIIPLLEEYCYEDYATLKNILGKDLVDETAQCIHHELFEDNLHSDLIQALLALCPEASTSSEVISLEESQVELEDDDDDGEEDT